MKSNRRLMAVSFIFCLVTTTLLAQTPVANFYSDDLIGCLPLPAIFVNTSINADSYLWDFGDGNTSTLVSPVNTYVTAGNYTVKLIAYNNNGEQDTTVFNHYISVLEVPSVSFTLSTDTLCTTFDSVSFFNTTPNVSSFLWDFGDGTVSAIENPTHIYQQTGLYDVTLIASNVLGCSSALLHSNAIYVKPKPTGNITSSLTNVCDTNSMVSFTLNSTNINVANWNFDDGNIGAGEMVNHIFSEEGIYEPTVTVENNVGCVNILSSSAITVTQAISPQISVSDSVGCPPLNVVLDNLTPNTQTATWTIEGNSLSGNSVAYNFTTTGNQIILLGIVDSNGCSTNTVFENMVQISSTPTPLFTINDTVGCAPLNTSISNSGDNSFLYHWLFSSGQEYIEYNPLIAIADTGYIDLTVTVSDPNGCESVTTYEDVIYLQTPKADIKLSTTDGCLPLTVSFLDTSNYVTQWLWNFGDGVVSTLSNPTHTYNEGGDYTITLVTYDALGCSDTIVLTDTISVNAPSYNYTTPDTVFSCGNLMSYFDGASIGKDAWLWDFGDGTIDSNYALSHTYSLDGIYEVSLTTYDVNNCQFTIPYGVYSVGSGGIGFEHSVVCQNNIVSFIDTSSFGVTWLWDFGDGLSDTTQNPLHQYATSGVYLVKLTVEDEFCTQSISTLISVMSCGVFGPFTSAEAVASGGTGGDTIPVNIITGTDSIHPFCTPYTINFIAPYDSLVSILWNFGDGTVSTELNPTHTYTASGFFDLSISIQTIDSVFVIHSSDFLHLSSLAQDYTYEQANLCGGGANVQFLLTDTLSVSYNWTFGDGTGSSLANPYHNYGVAGNYISTLNLYNDFGCSATVVKPISVNNVNPYFGYSTINCVNEAVNFTSNIENYQNYSWDFGDGQMGIGKDVTHVYSAQGTYWITFIPIDSTGCADSILLSIPVQVNDPVADFAISDSVGCDSKTINFTNLSQFADNWQWNFGNGLVSNNFSLSNIYSSPGVYDVTLIASLGVCSDTLVQPAVITIHESVIPEFTYTKQNACYPVTLEFDNLTPSYVSLLWDFGDGTTETTENPIHTFTIETATNIKLYVLDSNSCGASISHLGIEAYQSSFEITSLQGCVPIYASFSNTSDSANAWLWDFGNGDTSTVPNPSYVYSETGSYQVSLISTSFEGCVDTVTSPRIINVDHLYADFEMLDSASCAPMAATFTDLSINANNWQWFFGDNTSSNLQSPSHIYTEPGEFQIILVVGKDSTCFDTIVKPNYVRVLGPQASFTMSDTTGCDSLNVLFTNLSENYTFAEWFFGDGAYSQDAIVNHTYLDTGKFNGVLMVHDQNGCTDFESLTIATVHPTPIPLFLPSETVGCAPFTVSFDNQSLYGDSYLWDFGYGAPSSEMVSSYRYNVAGTYYTSLQVESRYGCHAALDSVKITVNPTPVASFEIDSNTHCFPAELEFINLTDDTNNVVFTWNFNNGIVSQETNPVVVYQEAGSYDVELIATNEFNCISVITKQNYIHLNDSIPPEPNVVDFVSVAENGNIVVEWRASNELDFDQYNVYRKSALETEFSKIDSIGQVNKVLVNYADVATKNYYYSLLIQPVDRCGNKVEVEKLMEYGSILLQAEAKGGSAVQLNWTSYIGCPVSSYYLYRKYKGVVEEAILLPDTTTFYLDTAFKCNDEYTYVVVAEDLCGRSFSSQSNTVKVKAVNENLGAQSVEVVRSTVVENEYVLTEWMHPKILPELVLSYTILRSNSPDTGFLPIEQLSAYATQYSDFEVEVGAQAYYYKIEIDNGCKRYYGNSISSSILLQQNSDGNSVKLTWSEYKRWDKGVEKYIIEKRVNGGDWNTIKEVADSTKSFVDIIYQK